MKQLYTMQAFPLRQARIMYNDGRQKTLDTPFDTSPMTLSDLTTRMNAFVTSKGWYNPGSKRPQTPRNLAISLNLEAAELLEHFQWSETASNKDELASELADVALYLLQLASVTEIDLEQAILKKLEVNAGREWR